MWGGEDPMTARVSMFRGRAHNIEDTALADALAPLIEALDVNDEDVVTVHVGTRYVSVQLVTRDRRGKVVPGVTTRLRFPVVRA